jgi:hypothetical protein
MSKILAEIAALLNQAENTDNEFEASAFMHAAQVKASRNAIDLATARAFTAKGQKREEPTHRNVVLGALGERSLKHRVSLFSAIATPNDVRINIAHNSTYVIAFGMPSDIDMVEALYTSLVVQMSDASERYIRSGEYKTEIVSRYVKRRDSWGDMENVWVEKPVDGRVARGSFQQAYASRIGGRLRQARQEAQAAAEAIEREAAALSPKVHDQAPQQVESGTALVLREKATEVNEYYKQTSTARGSYKGYASAGSSSQAHNAGRKAGDCARLGGSRAIA